MNKSLLFVLIALLLGTMAAQAGAADRAGNENLVQDRILVTLRSDVVVKHDKAADPIKLGVAALDGLATQYAVRGVDPMYEGMTANLKATPERDELERTWAVDFSADMDLNEVLAAYEALPQVEKVEPVAYVEFDTAYLPNDPELAANKQWYLRNMSLGGGDVRAVGGWNQTLGDSNVVVAVIDSGVDWHHPDLGGAHPDKVNGAIWTNWAEYYGIPSYDDDGNGKVDDIRGWDFVSVSPASAWPGEDALTPDNDPMDFGGHGTLVSGCVAAITDNGIGIAGTAPGCKIMALRAGWLTDTGDGILRTDFISSAIVYAANNGADIINCSWTSSFLISSAVATAQSNGVLLVTSAGNDDSASDETTWLAGVDGVIVVAATGPQDGKSSFSNFGDWVDIAAPGQGIYSTAYFQATGTHGYATTQGTSFSSPITAGAAALVWSANPGWNYTQVGDHLMATADNIDAANPGFVGLLGSGRVNLLKALGDDVHLHPAEFPTLYDALNSSSAGDSILVEGGTVIAGPVDIPDKDLKILGGYDALYATRDPEGNKSVIQGTNASHALRVVGGATLQTELDGFLIQGGGGKLYGGIPYFAEYGGGVMLEGASPTLRNLEITGNGSGDSSTLGCGGGMAIISASPFLENIDIHDNSSIYGAGLFANLSTLTMVDCEIVDNVPDNSNGSNPSRGGGVYLVDSVVDMTDCNITGHLGANEGGGVYGTAVGGAPDLTMVGGTVSGNTAKANGGGVYFNAGSLSMTGVSMNDNTKTPDATLMYGGGMYAANTTVALDSLTAGGNEGHFGGALTLSACAAPQVTNSVLAGNTAQIFGGGVYMADCTGGQIAGNTVVYNDGTLAGGGGLYLTNSDPAIGNNISAFNTGGAGSANGMVLSTDSGGVTCNNVFGNQGSDYSGIADPTGTAGNISLDPVFCDGPGGNFNLETASPCTVDNSGGCGLIGALGGGCGLSPVPGDGSVIPLAFRVDQNYPNPFNPATTIRFSLPGAGRTRVTIFDVAGRHVKTLVDENLAARTHEVTWTGDDDGGRAVAAGVYFYMVTSGADRSVGRMALIK